MRETGALTLVLCTLAVVQIVLAQDCSLDSDCSLTEACVEGVCIDPCRTTPCPMKGGLCKVVGHRPLCSCPPGHLNKNNSCSQENSCLKEDISYRDGDTYYDELCTQKCECHLGSWLCEETRCSPGLLPRGLLNLQNDPQCQERDHPAGDECCVLWVCADQAELKLDPDLNTNIKTKKNDGGVDVEDENENGRNDFDSNGFPAFNDQIPSGVCENVVCGSRAVCDNISGRCVCSPGSTGDPTDLINGCKPKDGAKTSNIKLLQITSNSIQVQFPDISGGNLMYVMSELVDRKDIPWENAIILEGNEIFTLTGLTSGVEYTLRWKAPDNQYPDIQASTTAKDRTKPKAILANRTHDTVYLSFDRFRTDEGSNKYVVHWKPLDEDEDEEKNEDENEVEEDGGWMTREEEAVGDPPTIQIKGLKPSTRYIAKVYIYEDSDKTILGGSTEEVEFTTEAGCSYLAEYYAVGTFDIGCESTCTCAASGEVTCSARCNLPLHPRGGFADDPLCVERTVDESKCCVLVTCASTAEDEESPCQDVSCGPNAECKHEVLREEQAETICVCVEGYKGDPDSKQGCSLAVVPLVETSPAPACLANNKTYRQGETWFDGCDYKCTCSEALEILCQSRCKIVPETILPDCELILDPSDSCCQTMVCSDTSNVTTPLLPTEPFSGCNHKNSTYKEGERFYDGCEQLCQCMGFGDLVCLARCLPTNPGLGEDCYTLPDPTDSCCKITVCDKIDAEEDVEKIQTESLRSSSEKQTSLTSVILLDRDNMNSSLINHTMDTGSIKESLIKPESSESSEIETTTPPIDETTIITQNVLQDDNQSIFSEDDTEFTDDTTLPPSMDDDLLDEKDEINENKEDEINENKEDEINEKKEDERLEKSPRIINIQEPISLGNFEEKFHGVQGEIFAVNSTTLFIKGFSYDGEGPDAFFYVGNSTTPIQNGVIVPYPSTENTEDPPILKQFNSQDIYLNIPQVLDVKDLRWISVWCRQFGVNFGDLIWGDKLKNTPEIEPDTDTLNTDETSCTHEGKMYSVGEQFYDGCSQFCVCQEGFVTVCFELECPSKFGLDVLSPNCIEWDEHEDFVPTPPVCCPPVPTCLSTGSCIYQNQTFNNYDSIPQELTGCEERCHCENSEVKCQDACYEIPSSPPSWLPCEPSQAILVASKERSCCQTWDCKPVEEFDTCVLMPSSLLGTSTKPVNETSIFIQFNIPEAAAGHKGYFQISYSAGFGGHPDPTRWPSEEFRSETGTIDTAETVSKVFGPLAPNTEYFILPTIVVEDCDDILEIKGEIITGRTMPVAPPPDDLTPVVIYLDLDLTATSITYNSARVTWRHFEPDEKPSIDGVQLRYLALKENLPLSQVPVTSSFIHRDTNYFLFENLDPETDYEIELDIIPVPGSKKELYSGKKLEFSTLPFTDIYDFNIELHVDEVGGDSAEISWSGVPSPDQKFVNIYRIIYQSSDSVEEYPSIFKISKIDSPKRILINTLQPNMEYQVWLEAYLTNGKLSKSNVAEFHTLPAPAAPLAPLTGSDTVQTDEKNNYFRSMVAAAIIAAVGILAFVIVLYFYLRRNVTYTHTINKERPGTPSSYENNGFKETNMNSVQSLEMDSTSNGHKHNP